MAYWETESVIILRGLIGDMGPTYTYEDSRLIDLIVVSARLINVECDFDTTYTIDVEQCSITPDPGSTNDDTFINLSCLKAACLILGSEAKSLAGSSFEVRDGSAMISAKDAYKATKELYDKYSDDFAQAKLEFKAGNLSAVKAILTPYGNNFNQYLRNGNYCDRY